MFVIGITQMFEYFNHTIGLHSSTRIRSIKGHDTPIV